MAENESSFELERPISKPSLLLLTESGKELSLMS
jgi:hypothetical protein